MLNQPVTEALNETEGKVDEVLMKLKFAEVSEFSCGRGEILQQIYSLWCGGGGGREEGVFEGGWARMDILP